MKLKFNLFRKIRNYFYNIDKGAYLIFIGMLYATIFFSSFVMGYKTVELYGRILCSSVLVFPLLFPLNDSISEILGSKTSYFMIFAIIICEYMFSFITHALAVLPSPPHWKNQEMYNFLTYGFIQIAIADSISLTIGMVANIYVFKKWGFKWFGSNFFFRSLGSTAIGELLFTISTNLIAFHNVGHFDEIINIITSDYIFKMAYSIIICIPNTILVTLIKNKFTDNSESMPENIIPISQIRAKYRT